MLSTLAGPSLPTLHGHGFTYWRRHWVGKLGQSAVVRFSIFQLPLPIYLNFTLWFFKILLMYKCTKHRKICTFTILMSFLGCSCLKIFFGREHVSRIHRIQLFRMYIRNQYSRARKKCSPHMCGPRNVPFSYFGLNTFRWSNLVFDRKY